MNMMTSGSFRIAKHVEIGGGYRLLVFEAPRMAAAVKPGQFVHVRVPALEGSALRRPFSVFDAEDGCISVLYKTVGRGTAALNCAAEGTMLEVEGPLGKGFPETCSGSALLVGGGYGVAPLHLLAKRLVGKVDDLRLFVGGRTKGDLLALDKFDAIGVKVFAATNDGSFGVKGFAVVPLDAELERLRREGGAFSLFACGPDGLLKAVSERAVSLGAPGWISTDRHMVCGVGACYACIQKTVSGNARCCVDGPVFKAEELVW